MVDENGVEGGIALEGLGGEVPAEVGEVGRGKGLDEVGD